VPQILNPVVLVLDELPRLARASPQLSHFINAGWGSVTGAQQAILLDFCRHAFDGSGADVSAAGGAAGSVVGGCCWCWWPPFVSCCMVRCADTTHAPHPTPRTAELFRRRQLHRRPPDERVALVLPAAQKALLPAVQARRLRGL
jgi:hypothetical protein